MGILSLVEDRPTPKAVYNWRVYALAAIASFASCMIGYDSAFIGTTIAQPAFEDEFGLDKLSSTELQLTQANIVSVYQAGAFFGALSAYAGGFFLGRRLGLLLFSSIFVLGAGIMLAANGWDTGLAPIYAGRVLAGFGVGGASNLTPIYIAELAPPAIRGRLVGFYELGWQTGGLVGFWINYGISENLAPSHSSWLIPFAIQLIPGGLLLIGTLWIKESPRWLYSKGRREQGLENLLWIRQLRPDDVYIVEEVAAIDEAIEKQRKGIGAGFLAPFKALGRNRPVQWRFFLGGMLFLWQNASGINAVNYYSPTVFASIGISDVNVGFLTTGFFGVVKTVLTFLWLFYLVDRLGRRPLLMWGALGGSVCMWVIGVFVKLKVPSNGQSTQTELDGDGIAAIVFFYLWTAFYTPSWNGTPWVINSEMFDMQTRALGQASAAANNWFWNFLISRFTPQMFATMSYGVYFFFASLMLFSVVFVYFLLPETKTVPLEAMDRLFAYKPAGRANKAVLASLRAEDEQFRKEANHIGLSADDDPDKKVRHLEQARVEVVGETDEESGI